MANANNNLKTASVLAFERKIDPSDAIFFAGRWNDRDNSTAWQPVVIREKSIRGTISNRLKTKDSDAARLDAAIQKPNLQRVDVATLPADADTLKAVFTLRVLGGVGKPSACNNQDYQNKLLDTVKRYVSANGFGELAHRYAYNLANGRFLWRNRVGAEQIEIRITHLVNGQTKKTWTFDALALSLRNFDSGSTGPAAFAELANLLAEGLGGTKHVLVGIEAYARMGPGQEVFPSQELILDRGSEKKSKTLYQIAGVAGIHSQKVGNALRTIDTWHPDVTELGPIAVEPYGSITTLGKACRKPADKLDFYNLLDNWVLKDKEPVLEQQHYVMATLIRGGVFGDAEKD